MHSKTFENRIGVFLILSVFAGASLAVIDVTVPLCFQSGVQWVVTGGTAGGITYVETTTNSTCVFEVANAASQTFTTNYTVCGASVAITLGGAVHEFIIVVQEVSIYNSATDSRYRVQCRFNTGTSPVETTFIGVSNHPTGNPNNSITSVINPQPVLTLYTYDEGSEEIVTTSTVLVLGSNVTARITLDQNTTDYNLQVISGEVTSQIIGQITILSNVTLLNSTTYCALHPVFLSFTYLQTNTGVSYAETQFQVFLPSVPAINLQNTNIQLKVAFQVTLCLKGSGCVQVSCPDRTSRRRRQVEDGTTSGDNSTSAQNETYDLTGGFRVLLDSSTQSQTDPDDPTVEIGTNPDETVCLDKTKFWGLIMGVLGFLVLACLGSCLLCFYFMRCRRREKKHVVLETSGSTTLSTLTVDRKLSGEPLPQQNFVLPRFVPYESSS